MAQRNGGRIDRFAQMNLQEQLIAKKRQEILEKQRTAQLAKAVAAAQNLSAKMKNEATVEAEEETEANKEPKKEEEVPESSSKSSNTLIGKSKVVFGSKRPAAPVPVAEQSPAKVQNFFCNDGSFLDHFKKILEKHDQPKPPVIVETAATQAATAAAAAAAAATTNNVEDNGVPTESENNEQPNSQQSFALPPPPPQPQFPFDPSKLVQQGNPGLPQHQNSQTPQQLQPPPIVGYSTTQQSGAAPLQQQSGPAFFSPVQHHIPPPPPPVTVTGVPLMGLPPVTTAPPPPPPPPQLPISLANMAQLYMIPAPEPLQLNAIPAPKELDLNAIPKPQLNLEAIQVPADQQQLQMNQQFQHQHQMQQHQLHQNQMQPHQMHHIQPDRNQQVFSDNNDQCIQIPTTVETLIALVAEYGDDYEDKICARKNDLHPTMWFLFDKSSEQYHNYRQRLNERRRCNQQHQQLQQIDEPGTSTQKMPPSDCDKYDPESVISGDVDSDDEYMRGMMDRNRDNIKRRIECRNELSEEERQEEERQRQEKKKMRKSRWGEKIEIPEDSLSSPSSGILTSFANQNKPLLSTVTRSDPQLLQYARLNYGSTNLSEEDWRKCEEHFKVNLLYQDMMRKRQEIDRLARSGKFKYEYDSDEDIDGGTWEHKLRCAEMEATQAWAQALTKQSEGKHHIGDFLPPEELKKFMEQYEAKKNDRQPDLSDYKEYKLKEDNIGFQMLQKLGWKEGQGLGSGGAGIIDPVNKAPQREGNQGLGVASASTPENCDNEYDAYRKRMMLAYRFRPNPLNNPRRAYY